MEKIQSLWNLLRITFIILPIVAGLDKFFDLLVDWEKYLGPFQGLIPFDPTIFMYIVGIIEIVAGIIVILRTQIGAYIVMAWLIAISIVLISSGYLDIAVRDLVIAIAAYVLASLSGMRSTSGIN